MYGAVLDAEKIIKWSCRLLYGAVVCVWICALPLLLMPITLPYLLAITLLVVTGLNALNYEEAFKELDDMYLEDISGYKHILEN